MKSIKERLAESKQEYTFTNGEPVEDYVKQLDRLAELEIHARDLKVDIADLIQIGKDFLQKELEGTSKEGYNGVPQRYITSGKGDVLAAAKKLVSDIETANGQPFWYDAEGEDVDVLSMFPDELPKTELTDELFGKEVKKAFGPFIYARDGVEVYKDGVFTSADIQHRNGSSTDSEYDPWNGDSEVSTFRRFSNHMKDTYGVEVKGTPSEKGWMEFYFKH